MDLVPFLTVPVGKLRSEDEGGRVQEEPALPTSTIRKKPCRRKPLSPKSPGSIRVQEEAYIAIK